MLCELKRSLHRSEITAAEVQ